MLAAISLLCLAASLLSIILLLIGLFRPVVVLWFLNRSNRLKVIRGYGLVALLFAGVYLGIKLLS